MSDLNRFIFRRQLFWLAHEPFIHLLTLGVCILAINTWFTSQSEAPIQRIEITTADVTRHRENLVQILGKAPDSQQIGDMVKSLVREEVLFREALKQGLDKDDFIVRQRLIQKMESMAQQDVQMPNESELQQYFTKHASVYSQAESVDFEHRYFNANHPSDTTLQMARHARAALAQGGTATGDSFMLGNTFTFKEHHALARDFGTSFADAVFEMDVGAWSEPITSPHELHIVRVSHHHPIKTSPFEVVRAQVEADMLNTSKIAARDLAYRRQLSHYRVILAKDSVNLTSTSSMTTQP